ncbi:MAG: hypothetical protein GY838_17045, partial [bacterium]|nr:hypothetical protein [bacterium]
SDPLEIRLTSLTGQGLPDFLPLGWTPVAAAEVSLESAGTVLPEGSATPFEPDAVLLTLPLPDWVLPTDGLYAVHYNLGTGLWTTLADIERFDAPTGEPLARIPLIGPGTVAIVKPDEDPATAPPLPDQAGSALVGSAMVSSFPDLVGVLTADPPRILATQSTLARVVARSVDGTTAWPSGLTVQGYLEERLILIGGGQILEAPFNTDLVLYHPRLSAE